MCIVDMIYLISTHFTLYLDMQVCKRTCMYIHIHVQICCYVHTVLCASFFTAIIFNEFYDLQEIRKKNV